LPETEIELVANLRVARDTTRIRTTPSSSWVLSTWLRQADVYWRIAKSNRKISGRKSQHSSPELGRNV